MVAIQITSTSARSLSLHRFAYVSASNCSKSATVRGHPSICLYLNNRELKVAIAFLVLQGADQMTRHYLPVKESFAKDSSSKVKVAKVFIVCNTRRRIDLHAHLIN